MDRIREFVEKHYSAIFWIVLACATVLLLLSAAMLVSVRAQASSPKDLIINGQACGKVSTVSVSANQVIIRTIGELDCVAEPPTPEPPDPGLPVVDPGKGITFLPNCVNGKHWATSNCEFTGTMVSGRPMAIRVDNTRGSTNSFQTVTISGSETNDASVKYEITVSKKPGDLAVSARCRSSSRVITLYEGHDRPNACPVPLGILYVNVRPLDKCPKDGLPCRPKVGGTFIY